MEEITPWIRSRARETTKSLEGMRVVEEYFAEYLISLFQECENEIPIPPSSVLRKFASLFEACGSLKTR